MRRTTAISPTSKNSSAIMIPRLRLMILMVSSSSTKMKTNST
jgi:hypothetical protein